MNFRSLFLALAVLLSFAVSVAAEEQKHDQTSFSGAAEYRVYRGSMPTVAKLNAEYVVSGKWSLYFEGTKANGWDEGIIGTMYAVTPKLSVGFGFGQSRYAASDEINKSSHLTRQGVIRYEGERLMASLTVEQYARDSVAPRYYFGYALTPVSKYYSVGLFAEELVGQGIGAALTPAENVMIYVVPIFHKDRGSDISVVVGARIYF